MGTNGKLRQQFARERKLSSDHIKMYPDPILGNIKSATNINIVPYVGVYHEFTKN